MEDIKRTPEDEKVKESTYRSIGNTAAMYAILRIGKKHKTMNTIRGFQIHMEREKKVLNADETIENEILIGDKEVYKNVKEYLKGTKIHSNNVLAREVLLTTSPGFFSGLSNVEMDKWKDINKEWLRKQFGENLRYATLHKDETTWHIHALLVPKAKNKKGEYILSNRTYFNGREKLRMWQDIYADEMQNTFKQLNRGIKYSKAKHIDIKTFYSLINQDLNEQDIKSICAKAKNSELLEIQMKAVQKTLEAYKKHNSKSSLENEELKKMNKELKKNNNYYEQVIELMSKHYINNEKELNKLISSIDKNKSNERSR